MAGGLGGQLLALDVETPSQLEQGAAVANDATSRAAIEHATMPAQIASQNAQASTQQSQAGEASMTLAQNQQANTYKQAFIAKQLAQVAASQTTAPQGGQFAGPQAAPQSHLFDPRIEQAMQSVDPMDPDASIKFDAAMRGLAKTVPEAAQFIGNGTGANLNTWRTAIGQHAAATASAPSPQLAGAAPGGQMGTTQPAPAAQGGVSPLTGTADPTFAAWQTVDQKGAQEYMAQQAMFKYQQTGNMDYLKRGAPDLYEKLAVAQKDLSEAQKTALTTQSTVMGQQANAVLGLIHQIGSVDTTGMSPAQAAAAQSKAYAAALQAPEVRSAYNAAVQTAAHMGWITPQMAQQELNSPITTATMSQLGFLATSAQTVTEAMKTSGQEAGNEARAKATYPERTDQYIGTDSTGRPIYHNTHGVPGAPDTVGDIPVNAKPSAGMATFEAKQGAYLSVHPGDTQGAIEFANGQRTLAPGEAAIAAQAAASRDAQTAALAGGKVDEGALAQQYYQQFTAAGAAQAPGSPAPGAGAAPGARPSVTPAQRAAWHSTYKAGADHGTPKNPYVPTSPSDLAGLPYGASYIGPSGKPYIKPYQPATSADVARVPHGAPYIDPTDHSIKTK
jgi:hypothetical protein